MTALWMGARAELRARWRGYAGVGLIAGLIAGAVLAATAGARRTTSAYPRFVRSQHAADALVYGVSLANDPAAAPGQSVTSDAVVALPQVAQWTTLEAFNTPLTDVGVAVDPGPGTPLNRMKLLAGRHPSPDRPDEVAVGFLAAQHYHLRVGSTLVVHFLPASQPGSPASPPVAVTFRVVGIEAQPSEFPPQTANTQLPAWVSPAFLDTAAGRASPAFFSIMVSLRHGAADLPAFSAGLQQLAGNTPALAQALAPQAANVERGIHLQAVGLWLVAALAGIAGSLMLVQLLARQLSLSAAEHPVLRSLGMTTPQLWGVGMLCAAVVGVVGALTGVAVAVLLSPLTPIGVARIAEPHPGVAVDLPVLALGIIGTLLVAPVLAAGPAWLVARRSAAAADQTPVVVHPSAVGSAVARWGAPPTVSAGVRFALEPGRGRSAVPVRTSLAAAIVGVASVAAALTFAASAAHLLATPMLYGVTYDTDVQANTSIDVGVLPATPTVEADPNVEAYSLADTGIPLQIQGKDVDGETLQAVRGSIAPPLLEGHLPQAPDEILLGSDTLRAVGAKVGDEVTVQVRDISTKPARMRVVGRAVLPPVTDTEQLGRGAVLGPDAILILNPPAGFRVPAPNDVLVRFAPGANAAKAQARLQQELGTGGSFTVVALPEPADLVNFGGVRALPLVLAVFLAALAAATVSHLLVTSVGRRRREFAILKALGFVPRQVTAAVGWHATTVAAIAVLAGLPIGLIAGRLAWGALATQLGVIPAVHVPLLAFAVAVAATPVVANAVAAVPGLRAGRLSVSAALRDE